MHTDYFSPSNARIRMFTDRFEFFNPGSLPKDIKDIIEEDFSYPRNPTIAKIFRFIRLSENIGNGFYKMITGWKSYYKIEPEIKGSFDWYKITFPTKIRTTRKTTQKTTQKIIALIKSNPSITRKELATRIGDITEDGIKYHLSKMKKDGKIKRVGPAKGGHWEIINND